MVETKKNTSSAQKAPRPVREVHPTDPDTARSARRFRLQELRRKRLPYIDPWEVDDEIVMADWSSFAEDTDDGREKLQEEQNNTPQSIITQAKKAQPASKSQHPLPLHPSQQSSSHPGVPNTRKRKAERGHTELCRENASDKVHNDSPSQSSHDPSDSNKASPTVQMHLQQTFDSFVSIARNASPHFTLSQHIKTELELGRTEYLFERARQDVFGGIVDGEERVILFAAADMFMAPSRQLHWFGPGLANEILKQGDINVRYNLLRLILRGMLMNDESQQMLLGPHLGDQFLPGLTAVLEESLSMVTPNYDGERSYQFRNLNVSEEEADNERTLMYIKRRTWAIAERNVVASSKIMKGLCSLRGMAGTLNSDDELLDVLGSLFCHPKISFDVFAELLNYLTKNRGFLTAIERRDPLSCVPQVILNVVEYCFLKRKPKWAAPRFLGVDGLRDEETGHLAEQVRDIMGFYSESISEESLFFEAFCSIVRELFFFEAANGVNIFGWQNFVCLLERFPGKIPLSDNFMKQVISMIGSSNSNVRNNISKVIMAFYKQNKEFVEKYKDDINAAAQCGKKQALVSQKS